jgi:hypothetical protein
MALTLKLREPKKISLMLSVIVLLAAQTTVNSNSIDPPAANENGQARDDLEAQPIRSNRS